jgi:hypothetical protein
METTSTEVSSSDQNIDNTVQSPILPLRNMAERHYGITVSGAGALFENACVCLDRHHTSPTQFEIVDGKAQIRTTVEWDTPGSRIKAAYANNIDATEAGGYACVIAAVELARHLYAVRRAETATGADYYLNPINQQVEDLEGCLRLEVSATDSPARATVDRRLKEKIEQIKKGKSNLPAIAGVIGFLIKVILLSDVGEV